MQFSLFILLLATSQPITILTKTSKNFDSAVSGHAFTTEMLHRSHSVIPVPSSKKRLWRPSSTQKNGPTRVSQTRDLPSHNKLESRSSQKHTRRADWYKQDRIYAALKDCLAGIQIHARNIREIASVSSQYESDQHLAWDVLQELKAILDICNEALARIKNGDFPLPSSKPGFFGHATIIDICRVIADILTDIRLCFEEVNGLARYFPIIQNICGDTLHQISGAVANLIIASSGQLGNIIRFIARIFSATPGFFKGIGFGFGDIPEIIAAGGSREFDRFL
ncbi:hypothetical protein PTTG_11878 [Puccinia triticina 1-1 BBBD Race 1]|uniref:Fungal STAND N-terminal Goodbye domain-containing protein n=1 Tax=Puccinia triticina (isolate 1-1 / race 1 (BBBD)) TaxID=630390 RepID=A0A180G995_PUCT1|nr:hypothetical protein PTTG_11878 [Puccinia triticina 1-1 BBBD Race 1]